jgi:hypothetical protein
LEERVLTKGLEHFTMKLVGQIYILDRAAVIKLDTQLILA